MFQQSTAGEGESSSLSSKMPKPREIEDKKVKDGWCGYVFCKCRFETKIRDRIRLKQFWAVNAFVVFMIATKG